MALLGALEDSGVDRAGRYIGRRADPERDAEAGKDSDVDERIAACLQPAAKRLLGSEELACERKRLLLQRILRPALDVLDAIHDRAVVDAVMAELVRERQPLTRDPLAAVEENERLIATDEVRARNALWQREDRDRDIGSLLDDREQVVDRLIETQAQLEARRAGGCDRLANVRRDRHDSAPERSLEGEEVVHDRRELGDRRVRLLDPAVVAEQRRRIEPRHAAERPPRRPRTRRPSTSSSHGQPPLTRLDAAQRRWVEPEGGGEPPLRDAALGSQLGDPPADLLLREVAHGCDYRKNPDGT